MCPWSSGRGVGLSRARAIVVLGCRVTTAGRLSAAAARRAARAARAYHEGVAPLVIATGGRRWSGAIEAKGLRDALIDAGVPARAIVVEMCSLTTWENALYTSQLLDRRARTSPPGGAAEEIAVVTCPWHMPRALSNFRAVGLWPVPLPSDRDDGGRWRTFNRSIHEAVSTWLDSRLRWSRPQVRRE